VELNRIKIGKLAEKRDKQKRKLDELKYSTLLEMAPTKCLETKGKALQDQVSSGDMSTVPHYSHRC